MKIRIEKKSMYEEKETKTIKRKVKERNKKQEKTTL